MGNGSNADDAIVSFDAGAGAMTAPDPAASGPQIGASATGKYLHINVPNFNDAGAEGAPMGSYLRLGAVADPSIVASPDAPRWTGEDLAAEVTSFIDDDRLRDGCPDFIPEEVRQAETAILHTKGGWRDHTDGNRITTTRGDKVEVIKGNYRMVVLGRQNDAAGWDVSGGHVAESGITFDGASVIEYTTEDYGGTWVVVENTRKGHVHTAYHGRVFDYYCGELVESITGSEEPTVGQPNPVVTDRTWAQSIASYTGSEALAVPSIVSETWAEHMSDRTNVTTMVSSTTATDMTSTTEADTISDSTSASKIESHTTADSITDVTSAATMASVTNCALITDVINGNSITTIVGSEAEIVVGMMQELTIGTETSITTGLETSVSLGMQNSVSVGIEQSLNVSAALSIVLGLTFDIFFGVKIEMTVAPISIDIDPIKMEVEVIKIIL